MRVGERDIPYRTLDVSTKPKTDSQNPSSSTTYLIDYSWSDTLNIASKAYASDA